MSGSGSGPVKRLLVPLYKGSGLVENSITENESEEKGIEVAM